MTSLAKLLSLDKKNILVIGGSGYLGTAASEVYAELGGNVIIASRSIENCKKTSKNLPRNNNQNHESFECDITNIGSVQNLYKFIEDKYQTIDVLILCAWNGKKNSWSSINQKDWDYEIEICLNSHFRVVKTLQNLLKRPSKIIMVSSMYGSVAPNPSLYKGIPQENPPSYGVAKAGIIQFTKYLATWLAKEGINVNCISPGPFPFPEVKEKYPEFCERLENQNPLNKVGVPDDLKGIFALLATDSSNYITGQNICVDGGWTIW